MKQMSESITFENGGKDLLAGEQTVVHRKWPSSCAKRFRIGDIVDAYGQFSAYYGQKRIARIRITGICKKNSFWVFRFKVLKTPVVLVRG